MFDSVFYTYILAAANPATSEESEYSGSSLPLGAGKGNMSDTFTLQGVPQVMMVVLGFSSLHMAKGKGR
jgi:hypothetical protein